MKLLATLSFLTTVALPLPRLWAQAVPPAPTTTTTTAPPAAPAATAAAQTAAATDTAKTADPKPEFFGYVGVYYGYDFNNPAGLTRPGFIYSENLHNQIAVNLALLGARYTSDRIRGTFAIQTGTYPDANYAAEPGIFKNIYEAWGGVKVTKNLWLDAGIFLSHIGLEGPISRDDLTLTRSIMAENSPYYEAGAKLTYDPGKKWLLNSSTFVGEGCNQPDSVGRQLRYFHNFYVTYDPSVKWKVAFAFDAGWQARARNTTGYDNWQGTSLIVRRRLWERAGIVGRMEYYRDPAGVLAPTRAGGLNTLGYSLGFDYLPVPRVILRAEAKQFVDKNDVYQEKKTYKNTNGAITMLLGLTF